MRRFFESPRLVVIAIVLGIALAAPSLGNGLQTEDWLHAPVARSSMFPSLFGVPGDPTWSNYNAKDAGVLPWITFEGWRIALFRPLTGFTHHLDEVLWPSRPWLMHAQSLFWFALSILAAGLLFRRRIAPLWAGGVATLLYAVADVHAGAVGWLSNRNAIVACALGVLAIVAHDRFRRERWRPGIVLVPLALTSALLAGELALGAAGYLAAHFLFLDPAPLRRRLAAALPWVVPLLGWATAYRLLGYGAQGSGAYLDPVGAPGEFWAAALHRLPVLLAGTFGSAADPMALALPTARASAFFALFVAIIAVLLAPLLRQEAEARFWALGAFASALPGCATMPSDRLLLFPALGGVALAALLIASLVERDPELPRSRLWQIPAYALAAGLVLRHAVVAPLVFPWKATAFAPINRWVIEAGNSAFASLEAPDRQQLIIVNAPDFSTGSLLFAIRAAQGQPLPQRMRLLYGGLESVRLSRLDSNTLRLRPAGGFLSHPLSGVYRGTSAPMRAGQGLQLKSVQIVVTEVDARGAPLEAEFRFSRPLENELFHWVVWNGERYAPFALPAVGSDVVLPPFEIVGGLKWHS